MADETRIHRRDAENTEKMGKLRDEHASSFILRALCVSVVKIPAKQSQFAGGRMKVNCRMGKRLRGTGAGDAFAKTKPIWREFQV